MPTDEQRMREQFREWADSGMRYVTDRRNDGAYISTAADDAWEGFRAGQLARDAEVQALRELLTQVTEELAEEVTGNYKARYGDPIHPAMEGRYARDMDTVYRARKLLAGGEGGEAE